MATGNKYSTIMVRDGWARVVAAMEFLVEYVCDYLSGQKFRRLSDVQRCNQKQK